MNTRFEIIELNAHQAWCCDAFFEQPFIFELRPLSQEAKLSLHRSSRRVQHTRDPSLTHAGAEEAKNRRIQSTPILSVTNTLRGCGKMSSTFLAKKSLDELGI